MWLLNDTNTKSNVNKARNDNKYSISAQFIVPDWGGGKLTMA